MKIAIRIEVATDYGETFRWYVSRCIGEQRLQLFDPANSIKR